MSLVSFVKVRNQDQLREAILNALYLIQYSLPKHLENIVIKPNLCYYWDYTTGQTTDPNFVATLIELIRDEISQDVKISVVESDASAMKCKYAFPFLGYRKMADQYNVELVNLSQDKGKKIEVSAGGERFKFIIPQTIEKADLKINVPKIKYMTETKISCALKNIFGCNPDHAKYRQHSKINETIVALNKIMKFNISILDGIILSGSHTRKLDLVMASQDPVAFDSAAAKITGVNPRTAKHIVLANKEGLGNITYIQKGVEPELFAEKYPKRKMKDRILNFAYKLATKSGLLETEWI